MSAAVNQKVSHSVVSLCNPMDCSPWNSPVQNTGVGSLSLLQGIFPTQEMNPGILHCRQIHYQLSQGEQISFPSAASPPRCGLPGWGSRPVLGRAKPLDVGEMSKVGSQPQSL